MKHLYKYHNRTQNTNGKEAECLKLIDLHESAEDRGLSLYIENLENEQQDLNSDRFKTAIEGNMRSRFKIQTMTFQAEEAEEIMTGYAAELESLRNSNTYGLAETNDDLLLYLKKENEGLQQQVVQLHADLEKMQQTAHATSMQHWRMNYMM